MRPKAPKHRKNKRRLIDEGHLRMLRQMKCILSGRQAEAAHVSYGDLNHDKPHSALGLRADDQYVVPLCPELHRLAPRSQHNCNEREWWQQFGIDPVQVAKDLFKCGRNLEAMTSVVDRIVLSPEAKRRVQEILEEMK